jgi:uncharacterized phage protein (TIGR01671 family)
MREIKFRGKRLDNGEWVYGFLFELETDSYEPTYCIGIEPLAANDYSEIYHACYDEVNETTIGQFTGFKNKKGVEIYEGDICVCKRVGIDENQFVVRWNYEYGCWAWYEDSDKWDYFTKAIAEYSEVIGNMHDNHELVQEVDK